MKKICLIFAILVFLGNALQAQERRITGTVTDAADGSTMPGVTISVRGTAQGTITDTNGRYEITVEEGATLVFSFIGMVSEERVVSTESVIDVAMSMDLATLQEIVVTALGISREKRTLGYSVQQVGSDEIGQVRQTDAISALQGRVAGVQVKASSNMGGSNKIIIRGASSMLGDNSPLIIVDGVPLDNSNYNTDAVQRGVGGVDFGNMLNDLDPNEIENISVLKGAAAALYGSRAANGVILITTKSAPIGRETFSIDVSSSVDFEQVSVIPELQDKYGGGAIVGSSPTGFSQIDIDGVTYNYPTYWVDESWGPRYDPNMEVVHWWGAEDYAKGVTDVPETAPWVAPSAGVETFWDLGRTVNNTIGLSKSGENYGLRTSYTNSMTQGSLPGSEMSKNAFRLGVDANLTDRFTVNSVLNFTSNYAKGRPTLGYDGNSVGQQFFQWGQTSLDYDRLANYKNTDGTQRMWNRISFANSAPKYADNPYWTAHENYPEDQRTRFFGNVALNYQLTDALSASAAVNGDSYNFTVGERISDGSKEQSWFRELVRLRTEFNTNARLNYMKTFDDIDFGAIVGVERRYVEYGLSGGSTSGGLVVPDLYNLNNSNDNALVSDRSEEKLINSVFSSVNMSFRRFLNVELSLRNDWSSTLPEDNNSYLYYGAAGSFVLTELIELPAFDLAKVRVGYTQVGNDTDPYRVYPTFNFNANGGFGTSPRLRVSTSMANPDLRAEITTTAEFGIDLIMLNNRVDLSATYFDKATTDQIFGLQTSRSTGYFSKLINAGKLTAKGWEVALGLTPVRTEDFEWTLRGNFTQSKMIVDELYGDIQTLDIAAAVFAGVTLRASVGDEYGQLWGYDFIYDDQGNKVVNADGDWMRNPNLTPLGSVYPDFNVGIGSYVTYKNFDFNFLVDIQKGGVFYSLSHMWGMYSGLYPETAGVNDKGNEIRDPVEDGGGIRLDGVTGTVNWNDDGTYTVTDTQENTTYAEGQTWAGNHYHGFNMPSAQSVFNADYIKLRELSVGYTFNKPLFNAAVKNIRISGYGRNLFTWGLDKPGFDPEMTVAGSGNIQGIEGGLQPTFRTFGVSLRIQI